MRPYKLNENMMGYMQIARAPEAEPLRAKLAILKQQEGPRLN